MALSKKVGREDVQKQEVLLVCAVIILLENIDIHIKKKQNVQ